jgi:magnesium chelatase accessory protein
MILNGPNGPPAPEAAPTAPTPLSVPAGGLRWQLHRGGRADASAPRVLLLHGTGSSGRSWQACWPGLAAHVAWLAPDLPGHGGTSPFADHRATLPRMADAVAALLVSLAWAPQWVVGHSAGAAVMVQMALSGQLPAARGLIALNGALQPLPGLLGLVAPALAGVAARSAWLPGWVTQHASQPRALQHLIASTGSQLDATGVAHYRELLAQPAHVRGVLDMLAHWRLDDLPQRLSALPVPLCLAAGMADRTVAPVASINLARRLRGAQFVPLHGLGHLAHEEAPEQVNELLLACCAGWLDQPGPAPRPPPKAPATAS